MADISTLILIGGFGLYELVVILAIVVILFGASKIPQLMRGVGKGISEFKEGLNEGKKIPSQTDPQKELKNSENSMNASQKENGDKI